MSFVVYDVETTGLTKGFDQILQFAATLTDSELNVTDQFKIRCRLMPHVVPSPEAMCVTGIRIEQILDTSLPSHYEMVKEVRRILESWCPTLFLGFNSLSFDEEFLRQAFYQCLYSPFLTNTRGNGRADVLNLCRITAFLRPNVIKPAMDENGRITFKLKALAEANDVVVPLSHNATADVSTTLALCQIIRNRAPDIWSQFLKFSRKASVESFITEEDAFLLSDTLGNQCRTRVVTPIGRHSKLPIRHYCLDLSSNIDALRKMSIGELIDLCKGATRSILTIRTNAAPMLWPLYDAAQEHLAPFKDESEILKRVTQIREDRPFLERIRNAAQAAEPVYPPAVHVEEQIYERGFPTTQDEIIMQHFHDASWGKRAVLCRQLKDNRYRQLARRLIFFERPDLLAAEQLAAANARMRERLMASPEDNVPWRSIPAAQQELEALLQGGLDDAELDRQLQYSDHLKQTADVLAIPMPVGTHP